MKNLENILENLDMFSIPTYVVYKEKNYVSTKLS
jgi:hypothetical protein